MKPALSLLILLTVCLIPSGLNAQVVSGPIPNTVNGHWYYLVGPTSWKDAEAQAVGLGGHLVTLNDEAENAWVLQTFGGESSLHIGFTDEGHEGQWTWISGEPVTYVHWNLGEPNNGMGAFPHENVSAMYGGADPRAGFWNDILGSVAEQEVMGVVEVAPTVSIRVSQVELCWPTLPGLTYQLQYRSSLTADQWENLGPPESGTGHVLCRTCSVPSGEPQRFYRVVSGP